MIIVNSIIETDRDKIMNRNQSLQNIYQFQKMESEILKRSISIYEAVALWLSAISNDGKEIISLEKPEYNKTVKYN
jgi:hypothetical protein